MFYQDKGQWEAYGEGHERHGGHKGPEGHEDHEVSEDREGHERYRYEDHEVKGIWEEGCDLVDPQG